MKYFNNAKSIIIMSFIILTSLVIFMFSYVWVQFQDFDSTLDRMTLLSKKANYTNIMLLSAKNRTEMTFQMSISKDPFGKDEAYMKFREAGSGYLAAFEAFNLLELDEIELKTIKDTTVLTNKVTPLRYTIIDVYLNSASSPSDIDKANEELMNVIIPIQYEVLDLIGHLNEKQETELVELSEHKEQVFHEVEKTVRILAAIVCVIILSVGAFVLMRITKIESQLIKEREKAVKQSEIDMLTGLYNRQGFESIVVEEIKNKRDGYSNVLMSLDLDKFKIINDTCGHASGDAVLVEVSKIFRDIVRDTDVVARLGGDEFGILLKNCTIKKGRDIANKIIKRVGDYKHECSGTTFDLGVSIGIISTPSDPMHIKNMYHAVDVALYTSKNSGRGRVEIADIENTDVQKKMQELTQLNKIREAFNEDRFVPYFQEVVSLKDDTKKAEVLIRMDDGNGNIVSPFHFLPVMEEYQMMLQLDRVVIEKVFSKMSRIGSLSNYTALNINLSGDTINHHTSYEYIVDQAKYYNVDPKQICFEITETQAISNMESAVKFIDLLRGHGFEFALDDFGAGMSSLSYLKNLPIDYLKIDGEFIKNIDKDEKDMSMVISMQSVASSMNLKTVAEYVENAESYNILKQIGVDYIQGYYLHKPEPFSNLVKAELSEKRLIKTI